jgi:cysteine-rich repeat protein
MRLHLIAAIAAVSLVQCSFDGGGLTGNNVSEPPEGSSSEGEGTTVEDPTTGDPTVGAVCGNFNIDDGEECDNGASNNGGGALCKEDCTLNVCGDGYLAPAVEGCDDGNLDDDDECTSMCMSKNCGDGVTDGMEQCDDGNTVDNDQCSNLCRLPVCGDGIVNGDDECDDPNGNSDMGSCLSTCKEAVCGDSFVHEGVEQCDDGNSVDNDTCTNTCAAPGCGDSVVQRGEECDAGPDNSETGVCLPSCKAGTCGDGFVMAGVEQCDDGNSAGGDGCSAGCVFEECGNMVVDPNEECDDGNMSDTDDCRNDCFLATCGDGIVAADASSPEQCDDSDTDNTDECPTNCKNAVCGDGFVRDGVEECDAKGMASDTCSNMCKRSAYWVFTTSMTFTGSEVSSLADADVLCTTLADGKSIEGNYKAWLGDVGLTAGERLFHSTVKYIRPDKAKVADDWNDLTSGDIDVPILRDENGTTLMIAKPQMCNSPNAEDAAVWTGSTPMGATAPSCVSWSDGTDGAMGQAGFVTHNDMLWSNCQFTCETKARLYCIEQPAM